MTISSASKLVNFRAAALQNLIRRHLLQPSSAATAAAASASKHLLQSATATNPSRRPSLVTNFNIDEPNPQLCLNASFRHSVMQFEAARVLVWRTIEQDGSKSGDAYCRRDGGAASYESEDSDPYRISDNSDTYSDSDDDDAYGSYDPEGVDSDDGDNYSGSEENEEEDEKVATRPRYRK